MIGRKKNLRIYKEEWTKLYKEGKSFRAIAIEYEVSKTSVIKVLSDVEKRVKTRANKDDIRKNIIQMYLAGHSINSIAKALKIGNVTVKKVLLEEDILDIDEAIDKLKYPEYLNIIKKEYISGKPLSNIAKELSMSNNTIMYYLMLLEVDRRNYEESQYAGMVNMDYFDELDRKKAVVLGFFIAEAQVYPKNNAIRYNCRYSSTEKRETLIKNIFNNFIESPQIKVNDRLKRKMLELTSKKICNFLLNLKYEDIKKYSKEILTGVIVSSGVIYSREQLVLNVNSSFKLIIEQILNGLDIRFYVTKTTMVIGKKERMKMEKDFPCLNSKSLF